MAVIDGVDQLDFFTGKQKNSNLEGFIIYNNDDIYGYKWRNWKMHLVELENMNGEPMKLNVPWIYNLITDPKEEYNMASEATWSYDDVQEDCRVSENPCGGTTDSAWYAGSLSTVKVDGEYDLNCGRPGSASIEPQSYQI
jgi:hypothetical protein